MPSTTSSADATKLPAEDLLAEINRRGLLTGLRAAAGALYDNLANTGLLDGDTPHRSYLAYRLKREAAGCLGERGRDGVMFWQEKIDGLELEHHPGDPRAVRRQTVDNLSYLVGECERDGQYGWEWTIVLNGGEDVSDFPRRSTIFETQDLAYESAWCNAVHRMASREGLDAVGLQAFESGSDEAQAEQLMSVMDEGWTVHIPGEGSRPG